MTAVSNSAPVEITPVEASNRVRVIKNYLVFYKSCMCGEDMVSDLHEHMSTLRKLGFTEKTLSGLRLMDSKGLEIICLVNNKLLYKMRGENPCEEVILTYDLP